MRNWTITVTIAPGLMSAREYNEMRDRVLARYLIKYVLTPNRELAGRAGRFGRWFPARVVALD